jgi:hypothetical protein
MGLALGVWGRGFGIERVLTFSRVVSRALKAGRQESAYYAHDVLEYLRRTAARLLLLTINS